MTDDVSAPLSQDDALTPPTFDILPLSAETRTALAKMGYEHPTPVQRAVFDPATRGKDLVVQARTGTGKTTAFGLPVVEYGVRKSVKAAQVLALCPTRELALQVAAEIEKIGAGKGIKPVAIYGGAPMGKQVEALAAGAQVVVGTPGRVLDHIRRGTFDTSTLRMLVIDEADEMLSMGFERELTAILDALPKDRQTLLFSATLPPDIERMSRERLRSPEFITLSGDAIGALSIAHYVYFVLEDKVTTLLKVIEVENPESGIVFCNTKAETEVVSAALQRAGYDADWLNGDLPQSEREEVMGRLREGKVRFLVATDVAARGIDISHLTHVINYDFPESAEQYVHRTGRTGRAGRTGTAISLVRPQDIGNVYVLRLTYKIKPFERSLPSAGEMKTRREADLLQVIVDSYAGKAAHPDDLSLARRLLTHGQAETIVAHLLRDRLGERQTAEEAAATARRGKNPPAHVERKAERPREARPREERPRDDRPREERPRDDRPREGSRGDDRREGRFRDRDERPRRDDDRPRRDEHRRDERPRREERPAQRVVAADESAPKAIEAPQAPAATAPQAEPAAAPVEISAPEKPSTSEPADAPRTFERRRRGQGRERERAALPDEPIRYSVSDAEAAAGNSYAKPAWASAAVPERPSDLVNWHPAEEEGDDRPIITGFKPAAPANRRPAPPISTPAPGPTLSSTAPAAPVASAPAAPAPVAEREPAPASEPDAAIADEPLLTEGGDEQDDGLEQDDSFAVVFVDVGRRDGARPADLQRVLRDRGGISRRETGRIRVRDKHALVSVRREVLLRAIEALTGAEIAGKQVKAEPARERSAEAT